MRRKTTLGVALAVVVASSGVGWQAGRQIRSPAEIAARTAPPAPSLISVPVEKRTLSSDVVVRGTVRYGAPQVVQLATSALKKGNATVTAAPVKGATLDEGGVAMAVSGRPVFVLQGAQPAYRDLGPGAVGDDVRQLEAALHRLGFDPGAIDDTYDARTGAAVATWYQVAGWTAQGPTEEQLLLQRTARTDLSQAQSDLFAAEEGVAAAGSGLAAAQEKAVAARSAAQAAPATEATARARADADRLAAAAEVTARVGALDAAGDEERAAQLTLREAKAADPPPPPAELAPLEAAARRAAGAVPVARSALVAAQAAAAATTAPPAPGAAAADAARAVVAADAEVARAADAVRLAGRRMGVTAPRADPAALGEIGRKLGVQVPADEVLFFQSLPLRIDDTPVKAGQAPAGPVMTVTNSRLAVDAALSVADAKLVRKGAAVAIAEPELGIRATGMVTELAGTPGTRGVDPQRFYLEVTPTDAPASLLGASVLVTIIVESTGGEVLAVPVSSLLLAGDGTSRVRVVTRGRTTRVATVVPGLAAKGLVAVTPVGTTLAPGDLVVVGKAGPALPAAATATTGATPTGPTTTTPTTHGGSNAP